MTAFTSLKLKHHGDSVIEQFQQQIEMLPEVLEDRVAVMLQLQARERRHAQAQLFGPQHHPIPFDNPGCFEPLQASSDLRRRERHLLAQLLMSGASEALEHVEQGEVEM